MNGLFLDQKFRKVIKDTSIKLIKDNSIASIESFQLEDELFFNLNKYVDDIIDYLNNSDIEKLIFKKDLKHLDLIYDEKERMYILVGKRKKPICKLDIADLEWTYKNIYNKSNSRYANTIYITYDLQGSKHRESYKFKRIEKSTNLILKMLMEIFNIHAAVYTKCLINYRSFSDLTSVVCINDNKSYKIDSKCEYSDRHKLIFDIMKEHISMLWGIKKLKDFKEMIKVIELKNNDLRLKLNSTFKGICFKNHDKNFNFVFSPFILFSEKEFNFKVNISNADFSNIFENKLCVLNLDNYEVTDFTLGEYIDNKNEILENIRLLMY